METTDLVVLKVPENEYGNNDLTSDQVEKIIEFLGYSREEARELKANTPAVISNRDVNEELSNAFRAGRVDDIPRILKPLKAEFIKIDDCHLLHLGQANEAPFGEEHYNWFRRQIGPFYPDKIRGHTIVVSGPDGKQISLQTWDLAEARQFDQIFERYYKWVNEQKGGLGPKFQAIKQELGSWLLKKLNLEGVDPQKDGFVSWFVSNKLSSQHISFSLVVDEKSEFSTQGYFQRVRLRVSDLTNYFNSDVIVSDLVEYLLWLEKKGLDGILKGEGAFQKNIGERAITHQSTNRDTSFIHKNNIEITSKRVNQEARARHIEVLSKYDKYLNTGYNHSSAVQKLVHDFRLEYSPQNPENRKKQIKRIIRTRNNKEQ